MAGTPAARRRNGTVLLAALVFVAILATLVTSQLSHLPFYTEESRGAVAVARNELDESSGLQLAIGILRADAANGEYDAFGDLWTHPHQVRVGDSEIEVALSDWVLARMADDPWIHYESGIPEGVTMLANEDPTVARLLSDATPNVNTAPLAVLAKHSGFSENELRWLQQERTQRALTGLDDFRDAPDFDAGRFQGLLTGLDFRSRVFLAQATIRRDNQPDRICYWVLRRNGDKVAVIYAGVEKVAE